MFIVKHRKIFYALTSLIIVLIIFAIGFLGINFSIDFTGGVLAEVSYEGQRPPQEQVEKSLSKAGIENFSLQPVGDDSYVLRAHKFTEREQVLSGFNFENSSSTLKRFSSIGPVVGKELRDKAQWAIALSVIAIVIFIAIAFRKAATLTRTSTKKAFSTFKYGIVAIIALLHDIAIPLGVFAVLAALTGAEMDILIVTALLTILGYSVNDTIVVFDRIRENIEQNKEEKREEDLELTVGKSLQQVYPRSIHTSLTTAFVLIALYFIGAQATQYFALILLIGVLAGTYSSIFLAAPLLLTLRKK